MYGYCKNCGTPIEHLQEPLLPDAGTCSTRCHVEFVDRNFDGKWSLKVDMNLKKIKFMNNLYNLCLAFLKSGEDINLLIRSLNINTLTTKEDFVSMLTEEFCMEQGKRCTAFLEALNYQKANPKNDIPEENKIHLDADAENLDEVLTIIFENKEAFEDLLPEESFIKESKIYPKFLM